MRKNLIILSVLVFSFMIMSPVTSLGEGANYQSKSTISFKKGPDAPPKEETLPPVIPDGQKEIPKNQAETEKPAGSKLPKTATNNYNLLALGIILLVTGMVTYYALNTRRAMLNEKMNV